MREPRPMQRFPQGGKALYELMRMDHEPDTITIYPAGDITAERAAMRDTLCFEPALDPMLYFWPVHGAHAMVFFKSEPAEDVMSRLAKALRRDGAPWVTIVFKPAGGHLPIDWSNWGDMHAYCEHFGVQPLPFSGEGGGAYRESDPRKKTAHRRQLSDREWKDLARKQAHPGRPKPR